MDKIKPGDRISVTGVFRCLPSQSSDSNGLFRTVIVATGVQSLVQEKMTPQLSKEDIKSIKKLAGDRGVLDVLGSSVAPSIEGFQTVKKSILL